MNNSTVEDEVSIELGLTLSAKEIRGIRIQVFLGNGLPLHLGDTVQFHCERRHKSTSLGTSMAVQSANFFSVVFDNDSPRCVG